LFFLHQQQKLFFKAFANEGRFSFTMLWNFEGVFPSPWAKIIFFRVENKKYKLIPEELVPEFLFFGKIEMFFRLKKIIFAHGEGKTTFLFLLIVKEKRP